MLIHRINVSKQSWPTIGDPPQIQIGGGRLIITAGDWPHWDGEVIAVLPTDRALSADHEYVYLLKNGQIACSEFSTFYGQNPGIVDFWGDPTLQPIDLLAWKTEGEWEIKELVIQEA